MHIELNIIKPLLGKLTFRRDWDQMNTVKNVVTASKLLKCQMAPNFIDVYYSSLHNTRILSTKSDFSNVSTIDRKLQKFLYFGCCID